MMIILVKLILNVVLMLLWWWTSEGDSHSSNVYIDDTVLWEVNNFLWSDKIRKIFHLREQKNRKRFLLKIKKVVKTLDYNHATQSCNKYMMLSTAWLARRHLKMVSQFSKVFRFRITSCVTLGLGIKLWNEQNGQQIGRFVFMCDWHITLQLLGDSMKWLRRENIVKRVMKLQEMIVMTDIQRGFQKWE